MKKHWSLYVLTAFVLQSATSMPVFADDARWDMHRANRDEYRATKARVDSFVDRVQGRPFKVEIDAERARRAEWRARQHRREARFDRMMDHRYYRGW